MKSNQQMRRIRSFIAFLTILSFIFGQVAPANAIFDSSENASSHLRLRGHTLRPSHAENPIVQAGLEEGLKGGEDIAEVVPPTLFQAVVSGEVVPSGARVEKGDCGVFCHVGLLPEEGGLDANEVVQRGAEGLEPRGHQSASVGSLPSNGADGTVSVSLRKIVGTVEDLLTVVRGDPLPQALVKFTFLRWPTRGEPTIDNQHPTSIFEGKLPEEVILIFNGNVDNYKELDVWLSEQGLKRPKNVQTDAWTIAAMIYYYFMKYEPHQKIKDVRERLLRSVNLAYVRLEGYFALIAMSKLCPDCAVGAVKGQMPLVVGRGKDAQTGNFLSSDVSTFARYTDQTQNLRPGDLVLITKDDVHWYRHQALDGGEASLVPLEDKKDRPISVINPEEYYVDKGGYTYFMEKEIHEQPTAIRQTIERDGRVATIQARARGKVESMQGVKVTDEEWRGAKGILTFASGTSDYAAEAHSLPFQIATGLPIDPWIGTVFVHGIKKELVEWLDRNGYQQEAADLAKRTEVAHIINAIDAHENKLGWLFERYKGYIGIAITQSGETKDTIDAIILAKRLGIKIVGIINNPIESAIERLTRDSGGVFRTYAGVEKGVASTKAHTVQITALELLALYVGLVRGTLSRQEALRRLSNLRKLPEVVEHYLADTNSHQNLRDVAELIKAERFVFYFGEGPQLTATAREGGLKLLEITYIGAHGYFTAAEQKHGPISMQPDNLDSLITQYNVVLVTDPALREETLGNVDEIRGRAGRVIAVAFEDDPAFQEPGHYADAIIKIPEVDPLLTSILTVVPLQLLALYVGQSIDATAHKIDRLSRRLYVQLKKPSAEPSWQSLGPVLEEAKGILGQMARSGELDMIPNSKLEELWGYFKTAQDAAWHHNSRELDAATRNLLRELRGKAMSLVLFGEHVLARMRAEYPDDARLVERVFADVRSLRIREGEGEGTALIELHKRLSVVFAGIFMQNDSVKAAYREWGSRKKGLAELLSRDIDKPRGIAKQVTVGDRLEVALALKLSEHSPSDRLREVLEQGTLVLDPDGKIRGYVGIPALLASTQDAPPRFVMQKALFHEKLHQLLRTSPQYRQLLSQVSFMVNGHPGFKRDFIDTFGEFASEDELAEEVVAKFYTERYTGTQSGLFDSVQQPIREILESVPFTLSETEMSRLGQSTVPPNLHELFQLGSPTTATFSRTDVSYSSPKSPQIGKLMQVARLAEVKGQPPGITWERLPPELENEISQIRTKLTRGGERVTQQAGLEEKQELERLVREAQEQFERFYGNLAENLGGRHLLKGLVAPEQDAPWLTEQTDFFRVRNEMVDRLPRLPQLFEERRFFQMRRQLQGAHSTLASTWITIVQSITGESEDAEGHNRPYGILQGEERAYQVFVASLDLEKLEKAFLIPRGESAAFLKWLRDLQRVLIRWEQRALEWESANRKVPSEAEVLEAVQSLRGTPQERERFSEKIRDEWSVTAETPHLGEVTEALIPLLWQGDVNDPIRWNAFYALNQMSKSLLSGDAKQELALRLLRVFMRETGAVEKSERLESLFGFWWDDGLYTDQLYNLARRARGLQLGFTFELESPLAKTVVIGESPTGFSEGENPPRNWSPVEEKPVRRVTFSISNESAHQLGLLRGGTWKNMPARHVGDLLGYLVEANGQLPDEEAISPGKLSNNLGQSLDVLEALRKEKAELWIDGQKARQIGGLFRPDAYVEIRKATAGLEEGVQVKIVDDLSTIAPELAAEVRAAGRTHIALLPVEVVGIKPESSAIDLYAHNSVSAGAMAILPSAWRIEHILPLPTDNTERANNLLQQAADALAQGRMSVIALDAAAVGNVQLPKNHPVTFLLNPATWDKVDRAVLASFLSQPNALLNLILDLTAGSIRRVTIQGRDYYAIYA